MSIRAHLLGKLRRRQPSRSRSPTRRLLFEPCETRLPLSSWGPTDGLTATDPPRIESVTEPVWVADSYGELVPEGESTPSPEDQQIRLPGSLPLHVQIINTSSGERLFDGEVSSPDWDAAFLTPGDYLLKYQSPSLSRTILVQRTTTGVHTNPSLLTLDGDLPRRVRICDAVTGESIWDHWIYGSALDVVGFLPEGSYTLQHAASREHWREAKLEIGVRLPSFRLYAEPLPDQRLLVDWGTLGSQESARVILEQGDVAVPVPVEGTSFAIATEVPNGGYAVTVRMSDQMAGTIRFGGQFAGDGAPSGTVESSLTYDLPVSGLPPQPWRFVDTATGLVAFTRQATGSTFDMRFLPPRDYLVQQATTGETNRTVSVSMGARGAMLGDTGLTLDGALPRRVRITNTTSGELVFDHWIYGPRIGVVDFLEAGDYAVQHAAPGENWRTGILQVGARLPSFRLYTERQIDGTLRVNWGPLGQNVVARLRGMQDGREIASWDVVGEEQFVAGAGGPVEFQVIVEPHPDAPLLDRAMNLTGTLPRQVRVFDPLTEETVLEVLQTTATLDLSTVPLGNFIVEHAVPGTIARYLALANGVSSLVVADPSVEFPGALPRRVIFTDAQSNAVAWDHWIYGNKVNVLGILPPGEYQVRHAASGEPSQMGTLAIGVPLPSYRLYVEQSAPDAITVDWGPLGVASSAHVQVFDDSALVLDLSPGEQSALLGAPQGDLTVRVAVVPEYQPSLQHCSLPTRAQDGTCRTFSETAQFSVIGGAMVSFVVPASLPVDPTVGVEVFVTEPPRNGTLVAGDSGRFQTYLPRPDFTGPDAAVFRVVNSAGNEQTVLVVFQVTPAATPTFAHFVPGIGTTRPDYRTPPPSQLIGPELPFDLVISSDFGMVVERVNRDGTTVWRNVQPSPTGAVAVSEGEVIVAATRSLLILDAASGILKRTVPVDLAENDVLQFANPLGAGKYLVSWYPQESGASHVGIWNIQRGWEWVSAQVYSWPRWADLRDDWIVVADTYGHRVVGESLTTGELAFEVPVFFPNDVRFLDDFQILITEEHADRVWTLDWSTGERSLVISAPDPRSDLLLSHQTIVDLSNSVELRIDPASPTSRSKSSTDYSGRDTVYAPNGAVRLPDRSYYVADTDNRRVIHVSGDGTVLAELVGLNNPNKVAPLWDSHAGSGV